MDLRYASTMEPEKPYKFVVRLPRQLRHRIGDAAQYYRRSINSEIVARIEQSFSGLPSTEANQQLAPEMHDQMEYFFWANPLLQKRKKSFARSGTCRTKKN